MSRGSKDGIFYQLHYFSNFHFSLGFVLSSTESWKKGGERPSEFNYALCPLFHRKRRGELMYLLDPSGLTGLEPATSALTGRCSCLLNYNPRGIRRDLAENFDSFLFSRIRYFLRTRGFYHLMVDWRIVGPSWIWTSVDILSTNLQSVPINHSGIDPTPNWF